MSKVVQFEVSQTGLRAIYAYISSQISFWIWDRKLSREYNDIMKQRQSVSGVSDV